MTEFGQPPKFPSFENATVEPSDTDHAFGFYSRPVKATVARFAEKEI